MHIRPEAYKDEMKTQSEETSTSTDFWDAIEGKMGRSLTEEEHFVLDGQLHSNVNTTDDIDIIERA